MKAHFLKKVKRQIEILAFRRDYLLCKFLVGEPSKVMMNGASVEKRKKARVVAIARARRRSHSLK